MNTISIIGGGIGGLMTALCFEKLKIKYTLYEQAETIKEVGAGIWLSPNALQIIEWINPQILVEIINSGNSIDRILIANNKLKPISDIDQQFVKNFFGYSTVAIHRGKLQKILYAHLEEENIILGKRFESLCSDSNNSYKVLFKENYTITTDVIIGADGINSRVRNQIFPKSKLRYSGQTCWRGIADCEIDADLNKVGFTLWGKKLQFGISRISKGKIYWFAVKLSKPNGKDNKETIKTLLKQMFEEFHPIVQTVIENTSVDNIVRNDLKDLELLDKWYFDKICLIGDAAHAMTPDLGQGGAQAIEDAYYLSCFIKNSSQIEQAFEAFNTYRSKKVKKLVKQSRFTSKIATADGLKGILRNFVLQKTPKNLTSKKIIKTYIIKKCKSL